MIDWLKTKLKDGREITQSIWHKVIDQSETLYYVIDSTDGDPFEKDNHVLTPARISSLFGIGHLQEDIEIIEENIDALQEKYNNVYIAPEIKGVVNDMVLSDIHMCALAHKERVENDGGYIIDLDRTILLLKAVS